MLEYVAIFSFISDSKDFFSFLVFILNVLTCLVQPMDDPFGGTDKIRMGLG